MKNHFLKASDEATLRQALIAAGILTETDDGDQLATGFALDVIGVITKQIEGAEDFAEIPGWHANLAGELTDEQQAALADVLLTVDPNNPFRVWA